MASVVNDMTMPIGLIWRSHLQDEPPPSFNLKAPTLLYDFIVFAVRGRAAPTWVFAL